MNAEKAGRATLIDYYQPRTSQRRIIARVLFSIVLGYPIALLFTPFH